MDKSEADTDWWRTDPSFEPLLAAVVAKTGMAYYRGREDALARTLRTRVAALGLPDTAAYVQRLAASRQEWDALIDEITIGETYFFREPAHFKALGEVVIPDCMARRGKDRRLRFWSAGCASGPEAYSISILTRVDLAATLAGWDVSILGTDVSQDKIRRARTAEFKDWELRQFPDHYRQTCLEKRKGAWALREPFKRGVAFEQSNLVSEGDLETVAPSGFFDVIFCRNIMIYFEPDVARRIIRALSGKLCDGGWLIAGHAEPHIDLSQILEPCSIFDVTLYRKRGLSPNSSVRSFRRSIFTETDAPAATAEFWGASRVLDVPSYPPVLPAPPVVQKSALPKLRPDTDGLADARRQANSGNWTMAIGACQSILDAEPLNADAHHLLGMILSHLGQAQGAAEAFKRAVYLDRGFALAHYCLGRTFAEAGDRRAALRSLRNASSVLDARDPAFPVRGGEGLTAAEVRKLVNLQLRSLGGQG